MARLLLCALVLAATATAEKKLANGETEYTLKEFEEKQQKQKSKDLAVEKKKKAMRMKLERLLVELSKHQLKSKMVPPHHGAAIFVNPTKLFSNIAKGDSLPWPEELQELKAKTTDEGRDGWKPSEGDLVKVLHAWITPVDAKLCEYTTKSGDKKYIVAKYEALTDLLTPWPLDGTFIMADVAFTEKNHTVRGFWNIHFLGFDSLLAFC